MPANSRPPPSPAPIPYAVDPHTVERAWFRGVKVERATVRTTLTPLGRVCSALPGSTVYGMGAPRLHPYGPAGGNGAPSPGAGRSPAGGIVFDRAPFYAVIDSWLPALSTCGRASAQRGRSGPKAGASPGAEPGSAPGGAERSRGLMR